MTSLRWTIRLFRVVTGLSLLFVLFLATRAAAQYVPESYKDALRGDDAKAWLTKEIKPKKKYLIGVACPNMPDPTWQTAWYAIQFQAQKLGVDARVSDAGGYNKLEVQVAQLENYIQLKVDAIMIGACNPDGVVPVLRRAADAGIKIVDLGLIENSERAVSRVTNDQREIGGAEGNYIGRALGGKGNVVMLYGPPGNKALLERGEGFKEILQKKYPQMKILSERFSEISRPEGLKQMEDFLQAFPGQINGVYTGASFLADGVADAVLAKRAGKILIATAAPNPGTIDRIRRGEIHMMADQQNVLLGRVNLNVTVAALNGEKVPRLIMIPAREVTAENIDKVDWTLSLPPAGWKP
jgi:inositol transport system substrate-binding protein